MKQVISINLQGRVIPIEQTAYDILKSYKEKLLSYFSGEEGCEEIINDIENRVVELFQQRLKAGAACITDADVEAVIKSIGQPEDFDEREGEKKETPSNVSATGDSRRFFRDEKNKILGGVCAGLANYFSIDVVIIRILFVLLFGVMFIPYLILWLAAPGTSSAQIGSQRKKLYRDSEHHFIAGVCSGLGHYFGVNVWIPRILFLIPFFSYAWHWGPLHLPGLISIGFSPTALIVYIILWIILPPAKTSSEKLEMRGEKVDMQSISNSIKEEMKGVTQRVSAAAGEISQKAREKEREVAAEVKGAARRAGRSLGDIIILILKIFAYFFIAIFVFVILAVLLSFGFAAAVLFPLKEFVIGTPMQEFLSWSTLILFFAVPIVGVVVWLIRRLTKSRQHSGRLRLSFVVLWFLGWASLISLLVSAGREFSYKNSSAVQKISIDKSLYEGISISAAPNKDSFYFSDNDFSTPFELYNKEGFHINNLRISIHKSENDSFQIVTKPKAYGRTPLQAEKNRGQIKPRFEIIDSNIIADPGIYITRDNKFRNQSVLMNVYIPVGKKITLRGGHGINNVFFMLPDDRFADVREWEESGLEFPPSGRTYIMREDGLYTADGERVRGMMNY